jgi:NAD(P)-dependent dehydrogenase (short-subunit alcohol dehydrogenase family)
METNTVANLIVSFAFIELLDQGNKVREAEAAKKPVSNTATSKMRNWVSSQIVTTSSIGGFGRDHAAFIYNASKAATTHMMKQMSTYLVPWGIRSNIIAPGCKFSSNSIPLICKMRYLLTCPLVWHTEMTDDIARGVALTGGTVPKTLIPEQRFGTEQEMGGTIVYLASPAGGYCNGLVMVIDGGYLTNHPSTY